MLNNEEMLEYYKFKRNILFYDEWLFYFSLFVLLRYKYYKVLVLIVIYGVACTYTSYSNLEIIETQITGLNQAVFLTEKPFIYHLIDYFATTCHFLNLC